MRIMAHDRNHNRSLIEQHELCSQCIGVRNTKLQAQIAEKSADGILVGKGYRMCWMCHVGQFQARVCEGTTTECRLREPVFQHVEESKDAFLRCASSTNRLGLKPPSGRTIPTFQAGHHQGVQQPSFKRLCRQEGNKSDQGAHFQRQSK